ncbi:MAG: hypothetical protein Q9222_006126, partial [Ikaeria aurantiellina]
EIATYDRKEEIRCMMQTGNGSPNMDGMKEEEERSDLDTRRPSCLEGAGQGPHLLNTLGTPREESVSTTNPILSSSVLGDSAPPDRPRLDPPLQVSDPNLLRDTSIRKTGGKEESEPSAEADSYFQMDGSSKGNLHSESKSASTPTVATSDVASAEARHTATLAPHPLLWDPLGKSQQSSSPPPGAAFIAKPPRPTSVPTVISSSTSSRKYRDGSEYPRYPDQSFAALQSQYCMVSSQAQPPRPRSSHPSQNSSFSSIPSQGSRDHISTATGAKTVGSTPAQSPGLFSPVYPAGRSQVEESEDSQTSTPLLHPAHMQMPKETHKLLKDVDPISGHKLINNYEFLRKLGSGQHGTVKLGRNLNTGEMVAVKIVRRYPRKRRLRRTEDPGEMVKKEIAILKQARHPHVVSLLEVIDDEEAQKVYLILEFVELGEIIWRKQTDKDVANFEMKRIQRELQGNFDHEREHAEVEQFNSTAVARRKQKAQAFEDRQNSIKQEIQPKELERPSSATSENAYWSLEHGGDSEDESGSRYTSHTNLGLNIIHRAALEEPSLATSIHSASANELPETPKPMPVHFHEPFGSRPSSLSFSPAHPTDNLYGPNTAEEQSTENILRSFLHQSVTAETEWAAEESEYMHVPCLTISQALDVFRDTVLGLEYLHYQGIIHRDIKPANLLWTGNHRVKISDFGVSYLGKPIRELANNDDSSEPDAADLEEEIELAKTVGTPAFYAPELCDPDIFSVESKVKRPPITGQIDVWALGVTLYCMIFGRLPFYDTHEFAMYEKIAKETLFIPCQRLKGVEDQPRPRMNSNKRFDDIVEYEDVDDELRDLLRRLLDKDPSKRISIKEVKHHPWVLRGIQNQPAWIDETDPDLRSEGRKIQISNQDVQEAVVAASTASFIKKFYHGVRRMGSAMRGRGRKRAESEINTTENTVPSRPSKPVSEAPEGRRASLRGDEQIFTALRASRENSEHPLSQSVTASPELKNDEDYFDDTNTLMMAGHRSSPHSKRPNLPERSITSVSTSESTRTIRPVVPPTISEASPVSSGTLATTTTLLDAHPAPGYVALMANMRHISKVPSHDRGRSRNSTSEGSSRSSSLSVDAFASASEDAHGSPSLAYSTASAAGLMNPPPALQDEFPLSTSSPSQRPSMRHDSSSEAFQRAKDLNERRRVAEYNYQSSTSTIRHRATSSAANVPCPPSPDDEMFPMSQRPPSAFGVSSSDDQLASNISESFSHPSIPSVISGASSLSATIDPHEYPPEKMASPSTIVPHRDELLADRLDDDPAELTPREDVSKGAAEDDEAGYNGEEELESDSDDGVLEMGGPSKESRKKKAIVSAT